MVGCEFCSLCGSLWEARGEESAATPMLPDEVDRNGQLGMVAETEGIRLIWARKGRRRKWLEMRIEQIESTRADDKQTDSWQRPKC